MSWREKSHPPYGAFTLLKAAHHQSKFELQFGKNEVLVSGIESWTQQMKKRECCSLFLAKGSVIQYQRAFPVHLDLYKLINFLVC